jgi:hypothetical protein
MTTRFQSQWLYPGYELTTHSPFLERLGKALAFRHDPAPASYPVVIAHRLEVLAVRNLAIGQARHELGRRVD